MAPRLSNALRAFASGGDDPNVEQNLLKQGYSLLERKKARNNVQGTAWDNLTRTLLSDANARTVPPLQQRRTAVRKFLNLTSQVLSTDLPPDALHAAAWSIYEKLLANHNVDTTGLSDWQKRQKEIDGKNNFRITFGRVDDKVYSELMEISGDFSSWMTALGKDPSSIAPSGAKTPTLANEFGHQMVFYFPSRPSDGAGGEESDEEFLGDKNGNSRADTGASIVSQHLNTSALQPGKGEINLGWLRRLCEEYLEKSGNETLPPTEMAASILKVLTSVQGDAAQNDLFELLGFDSFELIQELLVNRDALVSAAMASLDKLKGTGPSPGPDTPQVRRVAVGSQVTIQTESEKALEKHLRKQAKKQAKKSAHGDDLDEDDELILTMGLDAHTMREARNQQLAQGPKQPLFSESTTAVPDYPHVYDSRMKARNQMAFIAGEELRIPLDAVRKNEAKYEEICMSAHRPEPPRENERRVPTSEFGPIASMAFSGIPTLNRIQSIIFPAAYKTNENLLVCAPTGAGKTNVALMTIVRVIEQNVSSKGVVELDKFKIVYVAPMKALAAEMVDNFGKRLAPLGLSVKELTGDMQLTKTEIKNTQMIVTTPEKWDVITRKSTGDTDLAQMVRLLILDEVHLLHDDRGPVIESLVARTLRQVETSQNMIRIVGLSATLPNYLDVAEFLRVSPYKGLYYFDQGFRPVPLTMTYIGVKTSNPMARLNDYNEIAYDKVLENIKKGYQAMVFVHSRNDTTKTAQALREIAMREGEISLFQPLEHPQFTTALKQVEKSRNKAVKDLFESGFSTHHAGMLRQDRRMVEKMFADGLIKVLVCTATLAWGVNLPAHAVIIKGTNLYDPKKGTFVDLGVLDIQQIFGRAGRPQFDTHGEAYIITEHKKLARYISLMTCQTPIESQFINGLANHLNAEISLGTVASVDDAVQWLSYTYLFVRMRKNPLAYGMNFDQLLKDSQLQIARKEIIESAARKLDACKMIRFVERSGYMSSTDIGRTASHFYLNYQSVEHHNAVFREHMTEADILNMVCEFSEFENIQVREEELPELEKLMDLCVMPVKGGVENAHGKVNILLQSYVSRRYVDSFSLISDSAYVAQNGARIIRALFELAIRRNMPIAGKLLTLSKSIDRRQWSYESPLRQMELKPELIMKLEDREVPLTVDRLKDMEASEIGALLRHPRAGSVVKDMVHMFPALNIEASVQPITRTVLRVRLEITADFKWSDKHSGTVEPWWIWIEDAEHEHLYHTEYLLLTKKGCREPQSLVFTVPIFEPLPPQYFVRAVSDRWLGAMTVVPISFQHLVLPEQHPPHTNLLDLQPLPVTALRNPSYESMFNFTHFNPVQTQIFHSLFHTDTNVLVGAPTGSGKTVAAELALFRLFNEYPGKKAVYIAPLKALVRERVENWTKRLIPATKKKLVELTGETTPDMRAVQQADLIITTPEKWDGVSRSWQNRKYVKDVVLIIIDEIHMLEADRGPVLEVIVSRTNYISAHTDQKIRVVGLSTALANAHDLARWLQISSPLGLFNFRPSVRPVPLEVHIDGFPGKHYCPRMATMNKPTYMAIRTHSPDKPALVFVSSRRQTRLTALDLISYCVGEEKSKQFVHMPEPELESILERIRDPNLRHTLAFGIGLHHAGLHADDRKIVEELFTYMKIQVLIATSTLAWGVNLPAHLVVVKGTEYYDGKTKRYVDMAVTDVLQMMGRAGRPQYDDSAVAVILVQDVKKHFYKKFLYEPFPVESQLPTVIHDHINAEVAAGTISSKQDAIDYITWTYLFQRLAGNPSYYGLDGTDSDSINRFLSGLVEDTLGELEAHLCVEIDDETNEVRPTVLGRIASYYYLSYTTVGHFQSSITADSTIEDLLTVMTDAAEYNELPVRHNEDLLNEQLAKDCPWEVPPRSWDSPHTKANLLLQTHFARGELPMSDYYTDLKSVLDQAVRVLQAMIDVAAEGGLTFACLNIITLLQMIIQARWYTDSPLMILPNVDEQHLSLFKGPNGPIESLEQLVDLSQKPSWNISNMLKGSLGTQQAKEVMDAISRLPQLQVGAKVSGSRDDGAIRPEDDCALEVTLNFPDKRPRKEAYAQKWPRPVPEEWFLVLANADTDELLAVKRLSAGRKTDTLAFFVPPADMVIGGAMKLHLYVMSACYLGLDQTLAVEVTVTM